MEVVVVVEVEGEEEEVGKVEEEAAILAKLVEEIRDRGVLEQGPTTQVGEE